MKRFFTFCLTLLCCVFFSGCLFDEYSSSERKDLIKSGEKIFMDYLAKKDPKAKITEMKEITFLGSNHQFQLTEFAEGKYKSGSNEFIFAVNTKTKEIYSSERQKEFAEKMAKHINKKLNLQWTAVKASVYPSALLPLTPLDPKKHPLEEHPVTLRGMLPADIPDMDAYVKTALENKSLALSLHFLFTGKPLQAHHITVAAADTFSNNVYIELQRYPDSLKNTLEQVANGINAPGLNWPVNGYACLAEETVILNKNQNAAECTYQKWDDYFYKGNVPLTLHYPAYAQHSVKAKDGTVTKEENTVTAGKDLRVTETGSSYEFLTRDNRELHFYVFTDNLSAVENIKEIAERNRKFHDAAFNESRWQPILNRWAVGQRMKKQNQIQAMQQQDLIIVGKAAIDKLQPKQKTEEKK
ncbi:MAG: hypothetical protein IJ657_05580 [Acidaminococcaceae bacterium]|nr:hypothetical protein [Acidaminococcaceae bacterium]